MPFIAWWMHATGIAARLERQMTVARLSEWRRRGGVCEQDAA
jgi:hypothetical protein